MTERNDPCPCGSGRKFKKCCMNKETHAEKPNPGRRIPYGWIAVVALTAIALAVVFSIPKSGPSGDGNDVPASPPPAGPPPAWYYDEANDRHWDPGHGHWHDGPPPLNRSSSPDPGTGTVMPPPEQPLEGPTPDAWHYDEANNRHWHPGHAHWHEGPPPPPEER
ncbi:MAG TPA: SEC-C metal-binding domain-containing protein [Methylomirabilota bacterium]|nr:SEC-C metal-binding domain-containing protein [Methylomirabilota bacterium]